MAFGVSTGIVYLLWVLIGLDYCGLLPWLNDINPLASFPLSVLLGIVLAFPGMWLACKAYDLEDWLTKKTIRKGGL